MNILNSFNNISVVLLLSLELDQEIVVQEREQANLSAKVEEYRNKEREWREKISEDSRELEKATNKQVGSCALQTVVLNVLC